MRIRRAVHKGAAVLSTIGALGVALALLVGCAENQQNDPAVSRPAPLKPAPAPSAPTPAAEKPAQPAAAPVASGVKPTQAPATPQWPVQEGQPMTPADQDALAQMIRAAAEQGMAQQGREVAKPAAGEPPTSQPTSQPGKAGCGATGGPPIDLTPPPLDQPQPKFVCDQKKVVAESVWQGKTAEFAFKIANEGEAPLAIRIKPG